MAKDGDPHPMALSEHDDEICPVQVEMEKL